MKFITTPWQTKDNLQTHAYDDDVDANSENQKKIGNLNTHFLDGVTWHSVFTKTIK